MSAHLPDSVRHGVDHLQESVHHKFDEIKPKLRGWLHLATAPLTLVAGIVLVALSPDSTTRIGSAVFTGSALLLFTVSLLSNTIFT